MTMNTRKKKMIGFFSAVWLALSLAACGSSSSTDSTSYYARDNSADNAAAADANGIASYEGSSSSSETEAISGDKLVYTGSMEIETLTYEDTVSAVRERITAYNGIVESENAYDYDSGWYSQDGTRTGTRAIYLQVRIPTENFDAFLNDMEGTGKVTSRSSNVENITKQYNDESAEIEALEKQETRLLEMMDQAETIDDMIAVETRLTEVQTELNQKKSDMAQMDTDIEYSTVSLSIQEVLKYSSSTDRSIPNFGEKVKEAFQSVGTTFIWLLQGLLLFILYALPYILVIVLICLLIKVIRKRMGKETHLFRHKKKAGKASSDPPASPDSKA
jgi:hypothetical protein